MTIGELNTRITIRSFSAAQDDNGDVVLTEADNWQKSAKIEQNNGDLLIASGMMNFNESYKITLRYEQSRPTKANYKIEYKDKVLKIYNVRTIDEGKAVWEVITAYTSN
jgi:head-tail adaptor